MTMRGIQWDREVLQAELHNMRMLLADHIATQPDPAMTAQLLEGWAGVGVPDAVISTMCRMLLEEMQQGMHSFHLTFDCEAGELTIETDPIVHGANREQL